LHAGEPDARTAEHVSACVACRAYLDGLEAAQARFAARGDAAAFLAGVTTAAAREAAEPTRSAGRETPASAPVLRPSRPWRAPAFAAAAAAAALAFVLLRPPPGDTGPADDVADRLKGAPVVAAIVLRDGAQHRETGTVSVRAGDRLRFEVSTTEAGPLRVDLLDMTTAPPARRTLFEGAPSPGTTLTPDALVVEAGATNAWILAGPPEAVGAATADVAASASPRLGRLRLVSAP
jgi:hypothetical protein